MSILDANSESLATGSAASFRPPQTAAPEDVPLFQGALTAPLNSFMRSMAEAGRGLSRSAAIIPANLDKYVGQDNFSGSSFVDKYEQFHEDVFQRAVDYWTPKPGELGKAAQLIGLSGDIAGGVVQFLANPALLINTQVMSTGEDLVRQGVPVGAALQAGNIAGLSTAAGISIPIFGKTLGQRIATGIAGNVGLNVPEAAVKREIVNAAVPGMGDQFDPWDWRARTMDAVMGAVFGAKAHMDARYEAQVKDAVMALNSARALEEGALPGRPATPQDITNAVDRVKTAVDQIARGEVVTVPPPDVGGLKPDPVREQVAAEVEQMLGGTGTREAAPKPPVEMPPMQPRPVPRLDDWTKGEGVDGYGLHIAEKANAESISTNGLRAAPDGYVYLWKSGLDAESDRIMREARQSKNPEMGWDDAGAVPESYFAVDLSAVKGRIGTDPYTGELRVKGDIPPSALVKLNEDGSADVTAPPRFADDLRLPTDQFDEKTGEPKTVKANDLIARLEADAVEVKTIAEKFMETAAGCLLGAI